MLLGTSCFVDTSEPKTGSTPGCCCSKLPRSSLASIVVSVWSLVYRRSMRTLRCTALDNWPGARCNGCWLPAARDANGNHTQHCWQKQTNKLAGAVCFHSRDTHGLAKRTVHMLKGCFGRYWHMPPKIDQKHKRAYTV